jgi:hypothetical protein
VTLGGGAGRLGEARQRQDQRRPPLRHHDHAGNPAGGALILGRRRRRRAAQRSAEACRRAGGAPYAPNAPSLEAAVTMKQRREGEDLGCQEQHADQQGSAAGPWNRHGVEG